MLTTLYWLVLVFGCTGFESGRADALVTFACDDSDAWQAEIDRCVAEPTCPGVTSLQGTAEGLPFVVTSALDGAILGTTGNRDAPLLESLEAVGTATYFQFALLAESIGWPVDEAEISRLDFHADAAGLPNAQLDDQVSLTLWLSIPQCQMELQADPGSGHFSVWDASVDHVEVAFDANFDGDWVEGCIAAVRGERGSL